MQDVRRAIVLALCVACTPAQPVAQPTPALTVTSTADAARPPVVASPTARVAADRQTVDRPDDSDGYQIHVLYVLPSDGADEQLDTNGWIATAVASAQRWFEKETGRRLSFDTFRGELDVTFVRLSRTDAVLSAYDSRTATSREPFLRVTLEVELRALGFEQPKKVYAVYYGGGSDSGECFGGSYPPSRPGNLGIATVKRGTRCEEARNLVFSDGTHAIAVTNLHEIFHTLGAVARCAPHHDAQSGGHVTDDPQDIFSARFPRMTPLRFDAGRDDYFGHGRPDCVDLARSPFLLPVPEKPELPPLWPIAPARALDCAQEASIAGPASGARSGLIFDNMSDTTIQLFQLTSQGRTLRDTMRPWIASYQRDTPVGSAWLAADLSGRCLAIFVAESAWTRASVGRRQ